MEDVQDIYDAKALGSVASLAPLLLYFAMRRHTAAVHLVTDSIGCASFVRTLIDDSRVSTKTPQWTDPPNVSFRRAETPD